MGYSFGLCRPQGLIAADKHHVHIDTGKLACEFGESIQIALRISLLDDDAFSGRSSQPVR
jgi:hypothetical protein